MMKRMKSDELVIRSIHSNLLYIVVAGIIIATIVLFNFSRQDLLGPIRDGSSVNQVVIWSISDHSTVNDTPLINLIDGTNDSPEYAREGVVVNLRRNSDGSLEALPRFQGTLEYHKKP